METNTSVTQVNEPITIGQMVKFRYTQRKFIGFTPCARYAVFMCIPQDSESGYILVSKQDFNDYVLTRKMEYIMYDKITLAMLADVDIQTVIDAFISDKAAKKPVNTIYVDNCVGHMFGINSGNYSFIKIWSFGF